MNRKVIKTLAVMLAVLLLSAAGWLAVKYRPGRPVKILAAGEFHPVAHKGSGRAVIVQMADGARRLRLIGVKTGEGRELQVCLVAAADCLENESVERAGFIALGPLGSAEGDQSFDIPVGIDLHRYRAVTIWSRKYRVNFATAPLKIP
ncbi:MAG: DM13 domain-containing protein [Blastocatellia bacterium]|nr:DM13 domain-containing protein [Blastocatellia bacterium]